MSRIESLTRALSSAGTADPAVEAQAAAQAAAAAKLSEEEAVKAKEDADKYKEEEVTKVVVGLQVAKKVAEEKEAQVEKAGSVPSLAEAAVRAKQPFFTRLPAGVPVDSRCTLPPPRGAARDPSA
jgi:hypothetical protein